MSTWIFILLVFVFGLALAFMFDRMKQRPGSGPREPEQRSERAKWLYFWYLGRFPTPNEQTDDDERAKQMEQERKDELRRQGGKPEDGPPGGANDAK
jgi:hypothetical protein